MNKPRIYKLNSRWMVRYIEDGPVEERIGPNNAAMRFATKLNGISLTNDCQVNWDHGIPAERRKYVT